MKIFSGVKPSGDLHIGNYIGAIKQFVAMQDEHEGVFCIVDLHAITTPQEPADLRKRTLDIAAIYIALGINPEKSIVFVQSHIPAHAELGWILTTLTPVGELQRMTQYKDAVAKGKPAYAGLLNYPALMAADILLYGTEGVPVGEDQVQHIELARALAERFNNRYGETFKIPQAIVVKENARIMSLADPAKKMSKSDEGPDGCIGLLDSPDDIRQKIKRAVTDSGSEVRYDREAKPAIANLIAIFSAFSGSPIPAIETEFAGKSYAEFKTAVAEAIIEGLAPFQARYQELRGNPAKLKDILQNGGERATKIASGTLHTIKEKIGFLLQD